MKTLLHNSGTEKCFIWALSVLSTVSMPDLQLALSRVCRLVLLTPATPGNSQRALPSIKMPGLMPETQPTVPRSLLQSPPPSTEPRPKRWQSLPLCPDHLPPHAHCVPPDTVWEKLSLLVPGTPKTRGKKPLLVSSSSQSSQQFSTQLNLKSLFSSTSTHIHK